MNAFLKWAHEEGHAPSLVKVPKLKEPEKIIHTFGPEQIKTLLTYKPRTFTEARAWTLALLISDCGIRIDDAMNLRPECVDLDNLLVTITRGKGGKRRIVPLSQEMHSLIYRYMKSTRFLGLCSAPGAAPRPGNTTC